MWSKINWQYQYPSRNFAPPHELGTLLDMLGIPFTTKLALKTTILEIGWRMLNLQLDCNHK
jgi:hypothetical protein